MHGVWFSFLVYSTIDLFKSPTQFASLSLFYCYFHGDCSSELANCMLPPLLRPRCTSFSTSHPNSIHPFNERVNQYLHSCIPYTLNSETLLLCLFFQLPMTWTLSKEDVKTPLMLNWISTLWSYFSYCLFRFWRQAGFCLSLFLFALAWPDSFNVKTKQNKTNKQVFLKNLDTCSVAALCHDKRYNDLGSLSSAVYYI